MSVLRQRMIEDMQLRDLALNTQISYLLQVSYFARHFGKSPTGLGEEEIRAYQVYLTNEKKLSPSSIHIAVAALRFLYKVTLKKEWTYAQEPPHFLTDSEAPEMRRQRAAGIRISRVRSHAERSRWH